MNSREASNRFYLLNEIQKGKPIMSDKEERFDVEIPCTAFRVVDGERHPFTKLTLEFFGMSYDSFVEAEQPVRKMVDAFFDLGPAKVEGKK